MTAKWLDSRLICYFEEREIFSYMNDIEIKKHIQNYKIIGLIDWDNFLLEKDMDLFSLPTIPMDINYLEKIKIDFMQASRNEESDHMIKWYIKPVIFGGSPNAKENIIKVSIEDHIKLISFWNEIFRT